MSDPAIRLLQFPLSHYNEKARWALDWKRAPHERIDFLPGPHAPQIQRLTGQTMVPVLRIGEEVIPGSAKIIDELERRYPEPPLYPKDPALRDEALRLQARFDDSVGPMLRRSLFGALLQVPGYLCWLFSQKRRAPVRWAYRAMFPVAQGMMRKSMGITGQASLDEAHAVTMEALDFVAKQSAATGYLAGDSFSVADLTAAALLAPAANPPDSPMTRPRPEPEPVRRWMAEFADHPGITWVREQYRRHRPPSSEHARAA